MLRLGSMALALASLSFLDLEDLLPSFLDLLESFLDFSSFSIQVEISGGQLQGLQIEVDALKATLHDSKLEVNNSSDLHD